MRHPNRLPFAVAGLASLCLIAAPQPTAAGHPGDTTPRASALDDELKDLAAFGFSGAVLVSDPELGRVHAGYGAHGDGTPITTRTLFDVASLAKQFTAAGVMALLADGGVAREDSVGRFFPDAPASFRGITLTQLLTHTSGLMPGNATGGLDRGEFSPTPRDSALARIFRSRLRFVPGSDQAYSNAGYILLAAVIERASGQSYADYLRGRLFSRAGMVDTRFWGERGAALVAPGCDELGVLFDPGSAPLENWAIRGAGGVLTSVDDLERWMSALTGGHILPMAIVREMMSAQAKDYGYGWRVGTERDGYAGAVYHGGDFHGFGSQLLWYPGSSRLIVILCNIRHENDTVATRVKAEDVIVGALERSVRRVPQVLGPATSKDATLEGAYSAGNGAAFSISKGARGLVLGALDQRAVDVLWDARAESLATWHALNDRAERLVTAVARADTASVRRVLAAADDPPYLFEKLRSELQAIIGQSRVLDVQALGTYSAAQPPGAQWTVLRVRTSEGVRPYRLRWYRDVVGSYHTRSPAAASPLPLAATESGWIAWDLVHQGTPVHIERLDSGNLRLRKGGVTRVLVRRASSDSPTRSEGVPR